MTTEKTTKTSSMESTEQGTPSSNQYQYWQRKNSQDIYAVKNEQGVKSFHGPLNKDQLSVDPSGFTYSKNPSIESDQSNFESMTRSELTSRIQSGKVGVGS